MEMDDFDFLFDDAHFHEYDTKKSIELDDVIIVDDESSENDDEPGCSSPAETKLSAFQTTPCENQNVCMDNKLSEHNPIETKPELLKEKTASWKTKKKGSSKQMSCKPMKCSICLRWKEMNLTCSCPNDHKLCQHCGHNEIEKMLVGDKKARRLQCQAPGCGSYINNVELYKILPKCTVNTLEKKVEKDYLQYIKNWILSSDTGKLCSQEEYEHSSHVPEKDSHEKRELWPKYWVPMSESQHTIVYMVEPGSAEYASIATDFHVTMEFPQYDIVALYRIQNPRLWNFYRLKRSHMMAESGDVDNLEKRLYHGTERHVIGSIVDKGFDWRLCGKNATVLGQGTYFAKKASTSDQYTMGSNFRKCLKRKRILSPNLPLPSCSACSVNNVLHKDGVLQDILRTSGSPDVMSIFARDASSSTKFMFAANVLVGQSALGYPTLRCPPPLDIHNPHGKLYDSCVDNLCNPEKFVIFDHYQSYPTYVIEYTHQSVIRMT